MFLQFAAVLLNWYLRSPFCVMNTKVAHSRLCRLIGDCFPPDRGFASNSFAPQMEKELLISLSQVYREIKQWTVEIESDSDSVSLSGSCAIRDTCESHAASFSPSHERHCLGHIVAYSVSLISIQRPLIQHLTTNILVAVSEFSSSDETGWKRYIQLLCLWLKFVLVKSTSPSVGDVVFEAKDSDFDSSISDLPLNLRFENLNYQTAACVIGVLRDILKLLKLNMNDELLEVYLELVADTFSNLQWDSLHKVSVSSPGEALVGSDGHNLLHQHCLLLNSLGIFYGNLAQLCCSLVDVNGHSETGGNTGVPHVIIHIKDLIPKIVTLCIAKPENREDVHIFHYLRHKILMLLFRLVLKVQLEIPDLLLWLDIIESYFQDQLLQPLKKVYGSSQDCLEGSPFTADIDVNAEIQIASHHLQRLVVFLLLKCSFTLENLTQKAGKQFTSVNSVNNVASGFQSESDCSNSCEGASVLQKWLIRHLPTNIFLDNEKYPLRCMDFSQSFLKLYMHEDDLLFEMLLQLFSVQSYDKGNPLQETLSTTRTNFLGLISDIFNPIHLFHVFLAEILYDHQVLLDYLISKDTGAKSAEFLLRCLRMVCNSWNVFVEFPSLGKPLHSSSQKRRKVLADVLEFHDGYETRSREDYSDSSAIGTVANKEERVKRLSFQDAKECLLSLKISIDRLYQKKLFPYNPQVLLQRLSRFQEMCVKEIEDQIL